MVGYGPEDTHFVVELTYNYGIKSYDRGNDFISLTVRSQEALERAKKENWPILPGDILEAPGGYRFKIINEPQPSYKGNSKYKFRHNHIFYFIYLFYLLSPSINIINQIEQLFPPHESLLVLRSISSFGILPLN